MLEAEQIRQCLPHRYPFLLVDRVLRVEDGRRLVAIKAVTISEYCYRNPFDCGGVEDLAYPISNVVESFAQASGLLLRQIWPQLTSGAHVVMFGSFSGIQVLRSAYPGDLLELHVELDTALDDAAVISGTVRIGGAVAAIIDRVTAVIRPVEVLQ
jgi:3-hydroxyacyl-[acyl-carrier-protein] dehydratase